MRLRATISGTLLATTLFLGLAIRPQVLAPPPGSDTPRWLWLSHQQGIAKVNETGRVALVLSEPQAEALALDGKAGLVWIVRGEEVKVYSFTAEKRLSFSLGPSVGGRKPLLAETVERDESLWLAQGKSLLHVSSAGLVLHSLPLPAAPTAMAVDQERELLWLCAGERLLAFAALTGEHVFRHPLGAAASFLAVAPGGLVVVGLADAVRLYDRETLVWEVSLPDLRALAAAPSGLWVATPRELALLSWEGRPLWRKSWPGVAALRAMAANPRSGAAWLVFPHQAQAVDRAGTLLSTIPLPALGEATTFRLYVDTYPPEVTLVAPRACTGQALPLVEAEVNEVGSGLSLESVQLLVDGHAVSVRWQWLEGRLKGELLNPFAEGKHELVLRMADQEGNEASASEAISVDLTPPEFLALNPPSGSYVPTHSLHLRGQLSEPAKLFIGGQQVPVADDGSFQALVALQEGPNQVELVASDCAAHGTRVLYQLVADTIPPAPVVLSLVGAQLQGNSATVTGQPGAAEPAAWLVATNTRSSEVVETQVAGDGSFSFTIGAQAGDVVSLLVRDLAGNTSTAQNLPVSGVVIPPDPEDVAPPIDDSVATNFADAVSFLWQGPNPVQFDVTPGFIEPRRAVVLRGQVVDRQ
ncbi:MAG: Ig-like domain-containing protein, partial [Thermoanaerobaculum sp.]